MKILLLNENPVVSRLISLSAKKMSYDFEEINTYDENLGHYDVIIVDSDTPAPLKILKEKCDKLIFLAPRNQSVDIEAQILHKPFLPTDFLNLLNQENLKIDDSIVLPIDESENPYADISLDLDSLNLDDLPDENNNAQESDFSLEKSLESLTLDDMEEEEEEASQKEIASENIDEELNLDDLSLDEEQEGDNSTSEQVEVSRLEEKHEEALEALSQDDILNDEFSEEKEEELETQEQDAEEQDKIEDIQELEDKTVDLDSDLSQDDEISNAQEISIDDVLDAKEETQPDVLKEEEPDKTQAQDFVADDFPIVEEQETELDFDDIPEDAEFLGQAKEEDEAVEDFLPVVEDQENLDEHDEFEEMSNLSTQDQIKEELAQLDELEYDIDSDDSIKVLEDFKEEPILDDKDLPSNDEEVIVPKLEINDFDSLKESDIQAALGEEISTLKDNKNEKLETKEEQLSSETSEEIVNELSQSIAGAITSSIKDDTLKAALKGMNMNINISISFNEDKN
ncbi:Highly acidic protein [Campylobacter coli 76339]|nr:Highly acidic protein [Campylobacter coli 76339]